MDGNTKIIKFNDKRQERRRVKEPMEQIKFNTKRTDLSTSVSIITLNITAIKLI